MKIGILTQPLQNNYGGLLQNYALQQVLKRMGHDVYTIDWKKKDSNLRKFLVCIKVFAINTLMRKNIKYPSYILSESEAQIVSSENRKFVEKYIKKLPTITNRKGFAERYKELRFDAIVVGSDQVWRPLYNPYMSSMFLDFTKNDPVKRIAYAASFGTSEWEFNGTDTIKYGALLRDFNAVSVREDSAVVLCDKKFKVKAYHVCDPTFLLNRCDYERIVTEFDVSKSKGSLFYYILDPDENKTNYIKRISKDLSLIPFTVMPKYQYENRTRWMVKHHIEDCVYPSVVKWLRAFMDAEFVIVDSFHGAVFSIIFNKPFIIIGNPIRGLARMSSLLMMFGLMDRFVNENKMENCIFSSINWQIVNKKIDEIRSFSYKFLSSNL